MNRVSPWVAATTFGIVALTPAIAQDPGSRQTRDFVEAAAQSDQFEILESTTAVTQTENPDVRAFAQRMIQAHTDTSRALQRAAIQATSGIKLPASKASMLQGRLRRADPRDMRNEYRSRVGRRSGIRRFCPRHVRKARPGRPRLAGMAAGIAQLSESVAGMRGAERDLSLETAHVIPHVPRRLSIDATALGEHLDASAIAAQQVADTAHRVRDQVAVMLGAMQVGDSTRQRLEHIATGLEMAAAYHAADGATAVAGHFESLLRAQIEATAADSDSVLLVNAFAAVQPDTHHLLQLMDDRGGKSVRPTGGAAPSIGETCTGTDRRSHV